jgi:cell shape-determining protein MreD
LIIVKLENGKYMIFFLPLLIIAVLLEGTIITLPLVLVTLLCMTILRRDWVVFPSAFFAGLFLDALLVHHVGGASMFFLTFVFLIFLYQRKYEINSYPFVGVASFLGSWIFLSIFGYDGAIITSLFSSLIAVVLFIILKIRIAK